MTKYKVTNETRFPKTFRGTEIAPNQTETMELEEEDVKNPGLTGLSFEEIEEFECDECGRTFSSKKGLKIHKSQHEKETEKGGE